MGDHLDRGASLTFSRGNHRVDLSDDIVAQLVEAIVEVFWLSVPIVERVAQRSLRATSVRDPDIVAHVMQLGRES